LYIIFREGVADEDRRRLFQHARLSLTEQDSVNNLVYLGGKVIKVRHGSLQAVTIILNLRKDSKDRSNKSRIKQKYQAVEGEYELSRYKPVAQMVLEVGLHHPQK
jgi:syntaxin-binding protein 1